MLRLTGWGYIFVLVANWKPLFLSTSPPKHLFPCSYFRFPFRRPSWRCIIIFKRYSVQPRSHFIIITSIVIRALERGNLKERENPRRGAESCFPSSKYFWDDTCHSEQAGASQGKEKQSQVIWGKKHPRSRQIPQKEGENPTEGFL